MIRPLSVHGARLLAVATLAAVATACGSASVEPDEPREPAPPEPVSRDSLTFTTPDGVPVVYERHEAPEAAPGVTVVLVHCWSCDRTFWDGTVAALEGRFDLVTLDLPGHGESGTDRDAWSMEGYGADVASLVEKLGLERVILVGHSMGGGVCLEAARRLPGRVAGVVGVDTLHDAENKMDPEQWDGLVAAYEKDFPGTCNRFVHSIFLPAADESVKADVASRMCDAPPEVAIALFRTFADYDLGEALAATNAPIRCINSGRPGGFPTNVRGNRKHAPDFDAVILEDIGHFPMFENPGRFHAALLEILDGLSKALPGAPERASGPLSTHRAAGT